MNVLRQQDPSDVNLADYAWRIGCRTYSETKLELEIEFEAMREKYLAKSLVDVEVHNVSVS